MPDGMTPGSSEIDPVNTATDYSAVNNFVAGSDLQAQSEGSQSFLQKASNIVTKGIPLTGAAVVNSFYNTGVEVANVFGADAQKASIENEFGPDSDTTKYYQQHAGVIEGTALAAGSLLPGLGAIKALKLAQTSGKVYDFVKASTGLFSGMRDEAIAAATTDAAGNATGTSIFGLNAANKVKTVLAGAADQALQGAVYETATLATMHASPLTDNNTLGDDVSDVIDTAKGFGLWGGLVEGAVNLNKIRVINKLADTGTKAQEASGRAGLGNLTQGDRIVNLYDTMDNIPAPNNPLAAAKLKFTQATANRDIQSQLISAAGGDEELAGALRSFVENGRVAGTIGPDELQNTFGQLSKIGRMTDSSIASKSNDVFYVNKNIPSDLVDSATHDDVLTKIATGAAQDSRAFTLTNPNQLPTIGRATSMFNLRTVTGNPSIINTPMFQGALDAYKSGVDIFLDAKGVAHINPDTGVMKEVPRPGQDRILTRAEQASYTATGNLPPGAKPLNAVGMTVDLSSGKIFGDEVLPVVGDIAKPVLRPTGLQVGDTLFPHTPSSGLNLTDPMAANSRYVWADMRGIKMGDSIASNDLPMLEAAYKDMSAGNNVFSSNKITTFSDGGTIPGSVEDLLQHIADTKQGLYGDLLGAGKNADEIGHILNVPTAGMTKNFNTLNPQELITPASQSANIRHVRLAYDIGTTKDQEGNLLRGMQATNYRMKLAADTNSTTVANALSKLTSTPDQADAFFRRLQFSKGAGDADILGAGSSFFSNANAGYGTLAQEAEGIGKATNDLVTLRHSVVSDTLSSSLNQLRGDTLAAAEFGNFRAVTQRTGEFFHLLGDDEAQQVGLPPNTAVLENSLSMDKKTGALTWDKTYVPDGFVSGDRGNSANPSDTLGLHSYYTLSSKVADVLSASNALNEARNDIRNDWWKSQGLNKPTFPTGRVYLPPIDGTKYPFMAYVRQREGYALGQSGAAVITGRTAEDLQNKIAALPSDMDVFTKNDLKGFYRQGGGVSTDTGQFQAAKSDFDFDRNFTQTRVNSSLARNGLLNDIAPETRPQNLINDLVDWHFRQESMLVRDHVELHNASTFDQLRAMGDRFDSTGTTRFGAITPFSARSADNPFTSYIRTALGVSSKDNYPLWQLAQDKLEAFGSSAFNAVKAAMGGLQKGILPAEEAAKVSERFGLGNPYGETVEQLQKNYYGVLANPLPQTPIFRKFIGTANTILGSTVIRLDAFQQLIHAVTMPIMTALEYGSASRDLQDLLTSKVPGAAAGAAPVVAPSFSRVMYNAVRNYFTDDGTLAARYSKLGMTRDELTIHKQMIDQLTMPLGSLSESGWAQKIDAATTSAQRLTGTKFVNQFNHFMASDIGRQLGEALGFSGKALDDNISTFTNRVLGNQAAGQRAGIFQGPVGQAIGLFQSYQWNMMQQLLRHIGEGDVKALAMGAGMQSSIFGISSLPGFQALNQMISDHHGNEQGGGDLMSGVSGMIGKDASNYLLYGGLSGLLGTSLYSRGDLNPRRASILPINPLNFPSVAAGIRVYNTLAQLTGNVMSQGGNVPASLLLAAEHNGLSRPLSGLAELMQGFSTSSSGQLISTNSGLSDLSNIATFSRLLGARPLDEGIAIDSLYKANAMKAKDNARLQQLGEGLKTSLYGEDTGISDEKMSDTMAAYTAAGGNQTNFNSWYLRNIQDANVSTVNRTFMNLNNPVSRYMQTMMGGVPLTDFRTSPRSETQNQSGTDQTSQ
jgi:hypothetical protein